MAIQARAVNPRKGDAILKAAVALFPKLGYDKTTMDDVARHAGVTKQTVYSHYKSKDLLFIRMVDNLCQQGMSKATIAGVKTRAFDALLYDVGMKLLALITSEEAMAVTRLVVAESGRYPELARLYYESGTQRIVQLIAEFLDAQNDRGVVRIPDTPSAAAYFFALLKGQYFLRMTLGVPPMPTLREQRSHVREVVTMFIHLYGGKKPLRTASRL